MRRRPPGPERERERERERAKVGRYSTRYQDTTACKTVKGREIIAKKLLVKQGLFDAYRSKNEPGRTRSNQMVLMDDGNGEVWTRAASTNSYSQIYKMTRRHSQATRGRAASNSNETTCIDNHVRTKIGK
mmetsp:Transcript_18497/g.38695  ORF Transcript_18497/g.38695 Transcript_18497/m.38695 type:complete len:130 (+) Transcript_18497:150-539(+)